MNCPSWVIFCDKRIWDWNRCRVSGTQHKFAAHFSFCQERVTEKFCFMSSWSWPTLTSFGGISSIIVPVLAPNCDKSCPFLALEGCWICLPCLSGYSSPAWICWAGLQSLQRWKKLLSSVCVQLCLHILIFPLPKIGPTLLPEEPWQHLALLAGLSSSLVAALYWSRIQNKLYDIFICCNEIDVISGTFSVSWIQSVTANGQKNAHSRCLCF